MKYKESFQTQMMVLIEHISNQKVCVVWRNLQRRVCAD